MLGKRRILIHALLGFALLAPTAKAAGYDNWFTDADQLQPLPEARQWLNRALANRDPELIASLPLIETIQATPAELASLLDALTRSGFGARQGQWAAEIAALPLARVPEALDLLGRRDRLRDFMSEFPGSSRRNFVAAVARRVTSPLAIGEMIIPLVVEDSHDSRTLAHALMDRAREIHAEGEVRRWLAAVQSWNGNVQRFIEEAFPLRLPLVVAHRGGNSENHPENTIELIEETLQENLADGIEIDVSMTSDSVPILWHDNDPGILVAILRSAGLEPGARFRPYEFADSTGERPPIHRIPFGRIRKKLLYVRNSDSQASRARIPKLRAAFQTIHRLRPELKLLLLDIKTPAAYPKHLELLAEQIARMARDFPIQGKIVLLHTEAEGVRLLQAKAHGAYEVSHDIEFSQPITILSDYMKVARQVRAEGASFLSIGRPVISQVGFDGYLTAVRSNMDWLEATGSPQTFMSWTINDPLEFRALLGTGVHVVLTDQVPAMRALLGRYQLRSVAIPDP